jgi:hypothetical protein
MEEQHMERIKRFLRDETATAEATSTVIMIAAVGTLLAAGLIAWYNGMTDAFGTAGDKAGAWADGMVDGPIVGGS